MSPLLFVYGRGALERRLGGVSLFPDTPPAGLQPCAASLRMWSGELRALRRRAARTWQDAYVVCLPRFGNAIVDVILIFLHCPADYIGLLAARHAARALCWG